jgi:hypothetical protein
MVAFVARGSESTAGEAERSGEGGGSGGYLPTAIKQFESGGGDECIKRFVVASLCSE